MPCLCDFFQGWDDPEKRPWREDSKLRGTLDLMAVNVISASGRQTSKGGGAHALGTRDPPVRASMGGGTEAGRRPQSLKCKVPTAAKEGGHVESHIYTQHWTVISEAQAPEGSWGVTSEQPELHQANYLFAPTPPPRVSSSSHLAGGFFVTVA